ncbi:ABC transporter ATP-binding protein [Frondihabitans sucicola]|uniref:ABC transporter ATP-binding protein n=1 Tax=Frondihabitans sucicola TaxID=1268041 RepID=A0ABN6XVL2_9MICO|nr:ABC transporter ATP-binding protein [Frondihabitans sucicola]BDZ48986.1 ABC transporter ATP-binding protein [Frondihabitans sucicola]
MTAPLLEVRDLGYTYRRDPALENVSFTVDRGQNLGIVGESGAGKTTLLRLLLGLTRPTTGGIDTDGVPFDAGDRAALRRHRTFAQAVFQDPYSSLDPRQNVGRIVSEPLRSLHLSTTGSETRTRVASALEAVGLPADAAERYPHEFSGGQRQRIAIARAIVPRPQLLVADEPVSALDLSTRVRIVELLSSLSIGGLTVVVVSHDLGTVAALCERTLVLERGRVVEQGPTAALLAAPEHPYTRKLLAAVPRLPRR